MPKMITYRYRAPFGPSRRAYLVPLLPLAGLILVCALFVATHRPLFTAGGLDPVRSGDYGGDPRAVIWVDEGLRYRIHVREGAAEPTWCSLVMSNGLRHSLTIDRARRGDPETVDGHRWFGAFRSPADGSAVVVCDRSEEALRVHVDAPGMLGMGVLLLLWPIVLIGTGVGLVVVRNRRAATRRTPRPPEPDPVTPAAALAAGDRTQTTVYFRNGTFVPAGGRGPQEAKEFAAERLMAPRDPADFRTAEAGDGGHLVTFPDLTVYLSPDEAKHAGVRDLGRHALAKLRRDARDPDVTYIRAREDAPAPV